MTEFELKRLEFLMKAAERGEWVQLGVGDKEFIEKLEELVQKNLDNFS
jgi:hypothetical protein